MAEIFGNFREGPASPEYIVLSFSSRALPLDQRWRNTSLSADFLADYWDTFFHKNKGFLPGARDSVSYVANELLENAVKFQKETDGHPVRIALYLEGGMLWIYVTNAVAPERQGAFKALIDELLAGDPGKLYLSRLENSRKDKGFSRLGFLTMINDYDVELAWKFESLSGTLTVTTMARLEVAPAPSPK